MGKFRNILALVLALLLCGVAQANDRAAMRGCSLLFTKGKELEYLAAKTPQERVEKRLEYFRMLEDLGTSTETLDRDYVKATDLSTAWWNIAFFRPGIEVDARELRMPELRTLLESPDRALYMRSLGTAYRIADFRKNTAYQIRQSFDWISNQARGLNSWRNSVRTRATPPAVTRAMDRISEKTRPTAEAVAARTQTAMQRLWNGVKLIPDMISVRASVSNAERTRSLTLYSVLRVRDGFFEIANLLSPVSLHLLLPEVWIEKTAPIFLKLEKNIRYVPNETEQALLREYRAEKVFTGRQALLQKHPTWFKGIHIAKSTRQWASVAGLTLAVTAGLVQSVWGDGTVDVETFLTDPKYAPRPGEVQIINVPLPVPHIALRIGEFVYSYGKKEITRVPIADYLSAQKKKPTTGFLRFFARERSAQVVTLDLGEESIRELKTDFETSVGIPYDVLYSPAELDEMSPPEVRLFRRLYLGKDWKTHRSKVMANDSPTMVMQAIKRVSSIQVPDLIDPSPSALVMYFAAERIAGAPVVSSVRFVNEGEKANSTLQLARNIWINAREVRLWTHPTFFLGTRLKRLGEEYVNDRRANDRDTVQGEMEGDAELRSFFDRKEQIANDPVLRETVMRSFHERYEKGLAELEHSDVEVEEVLEGLYRLEYYATAEKELLGTKSFDLEKALSDPTFLGELKSLSAPLTE